MSRKFGLIGYPLGHSFSRGYHNERFEKWGLDAMYENYELTSIEALPALIEQEPLLEGLNVTIPYKEVVIPLLDSLDESAAEIGAVNVIRIGRAGNKPYLKGYNSDYIGFRNTLQPLLKEHHTAALVLGTGGASKAVCAALRQLHIKVQPVSRTPHGDVIGYDDLTADMMQQHTIIVNTTPLGMSPNTHTAPLIPYHLLTSQHLCYDVVYNPATTRFMQLAAEQGANVCNGLEMLHEQARVAWEMWNENSE